MTENFETNGMDEDYSFSVDEIGEDDVMEDGELGEDWEDDDLEDDFEEDWEDEEDEFLPALAGLAPLLLKAAPIALNAISGFLGEDDYEDDGEDSEDELRAEVVPGLSALDEAEAEELIAQSAKTPSSNDAAALAAAATAKLTGKTPPKVKKAAAVLVTKQAKIAKALRKIRGGKKLAPVQNAITKKTVATLARKARKGKPVSKRTAVRVLKKQARRVLKSPKQVAKALKRNTVKRKKLNRSAIARAERGIA